MIAALANLFGLKTEPEKKDRALELATAALLVQVSVADDQFDAREKEALLAALTGHFHLSVEEADTLLKAAVDAQAEASSLYKFTQTISAELDQNARQEIVRLLWQVAVADDQIDNMELNAIAKIAGLLGVAPEDRIRIKHEVEGRR